MAAKTSKGTLAILAGGGPAPGINGVIGAAALEGIRNGMRVLGLQEGYRWLVRDDVSRARELRTEELSGIHRQGGSILGTSRENPTTDPDKMRNALSALKRLGVTHLLAIGGDDTAFSTWKISGMKDAGIAFACVPKTIDNDLPLPENVSCFGYETARQLGVELVANLMEDARTTVRWYFVVAMGRKAGHLALGIGKAAGAPLTLIAEEFPPGTISIERLADLLETTIVKRRVLGSRDGLVVLAEGILERFAEEDLRKVGEVEQDEFGHLRMAELDLGKLLKNVVRKRFAARGEKMQIVDKEIGYELRCAAPVPFDAEYTRDLGHAAVRFLLGGGSGALVTVVLGRAVPMDLAGLVDPSTGKIRVRFVDVQGEGYRVARDYMTRLRGSDFEDAELVGRMAAEMKTTPEAFAGRFAPLTAGE